MNAQVVALFAATFSVAFFHTLSPDHWLPFVMLGKSQKWSWFKTELTALLAGSGHIGTSILIALVGIFIGAELSEQFASIAEVATGSALIIFGFAYAFYAWRKGGHVHFTLGGRHLGGEHAHSHDHAHDDDPFPAADDHHSHADHDSDHGYAHADSSTSKAPYTVVVIMGLTPCVALLPLAFAAASHGMPITMGVIGLFAVATLVPILGLTFLGSTGLGLLKLNWIEKYADIVTGIVIGCIGIATVFLGL